MKTIAKETMTARAYISIAAILIGMLSGCSETTIRYSSLYAWLEAQNIDFPENIRWDIVETYNRVSDLPHLEAEILTRSYIGYYGQKDVALRINIQIVRYREGIDSQTEHKYSYDFTPDAVFVPEIKGLENYDAKKIECGRSLQESITLCIVHFNFNNRYSFYVVAHGNGQIGNDDWNRILNLLFARMKIDDLIYVTNE